MENIKEIYKKVITNGFYDEHYGMKAEIIEGKKHGVCIDFSKELIEELRKNGYLAGLISTLNEDGYLHAAVLYKNLENGQINIADPVTDVKKLTGLTDEQRYSEIENILRGNNWSKNLKEYIEEYGPITEYLDDFTTIRKDIKDGEDLKRNLHLNFASKPRHIQHPIEKVVNISQIDELVEDPMKEACKVLYNKGIPTSCSDNFEEKRIAEIFLPYTNLSSENKRKLIELSHSNPEHYEFRSPGGSWMRQAKTDIPVDETDYSQARGFVIKASYNENQTMGDISKQLAKVFERQTYMEGIYTREDILRNIHKLEDVNNLLSGAKNIVLPEPVQSSKTNEQLAKLNDLKYSKRFNIFYENNIDKTRYLETLYRDEKGNIRSKMEIASENGLIYDEDSNMIFETEQELKEYKKSNYITPADIVEADMDKGISTSIINKIRSFFNNIIEKLKGKGER